MPSTGSSSAALTRRTFIAGTGAAGVLAATAVPASASGGEMLSNGDMRIRWQRSGQQWVTAAVEVRQHESWQRLFTPAGHYTVLVADEPPDGNDIKHGRAGTPITLVPLHRRGGRDSMEFRAVDPAGRLRAVWSPAQQVPNALAVEITWTARRAGWYSVAAPAVATVDPEEFRWGVVPGFWSSTVLGDSDDETMYRYGLGIPPVGYQGDERSAPSLLAAIEGQHGTLATVADPSLARDPWPEDESNQSAWQVSLALRDADGALTPTLYSPVLGLDGSYLEAGESLTVSYLVMADPGSWQNVSETVVRDVYTLQSYLDLARNTESLSHRLNRIHDYVVTPASGWHTWEFRGHELGAESGKLSDVGALWMWQRITADPFIAEERLPQARGFKLAQQGIADDGAFEGAALGEYFKDGQWISEIVWASKDAFGADYVSPIFTTFYTMADGGNVALFDPDDEEILSIVDEGAEKLLAWQHEDGSFDIGYERAAPEVVKYPELTDLRATWYGLLVGYRVLEDERYLEAARRGADWFITHAVETGNMLGVCDDARVIRDFQVIFAAQALLDLHDVTQDSRYRDAAIEVARLYTTHILTHPTATEEPKTFNGHDVLDWQLSQVGLPYEHAGFNGTLRGNGPITIASHAGAFVRFYELTEDSLFLDLARAAARGRDEFVGPNSGIPSYYWRDGNLGGDRFPWHGWWHIGWVIDYLLAEAHLRSQGQIDFPRGFCTAKVGSHQPYGFAPGTIFGSEAALRMPRTLVEIDDPSVDWITAVSSDDSELFLIAVNSSPEPVTANVTLNPRALRPGERSAWGATRTMTGTVQRAGDDRWTVTLDADGIAVFAVETSFSIDPQGAELRSFTVDGSETAPTVSWSFWAETTSWVEWRTEDADWVALDQVTDHTSSTTLDLSEVETPATVQVRIATDLPNGEIGHSEVTDWRVPLVGPNIARGCAVEVSSTYAEQYPGENLVDGDTESGSSRWLSAVDDQTPTATITLEEPTTPRLLRLYTGLQDKQVVHAWTVEARTGSGWQEVASVTGNADVRADVELQPVETDQVRVVISGRSHDHIDVARVFEIEIFDVYEP